MDIPNKSNPMTRHCCVQGLPGLNKLSISCHAYHSKKASAYLDMNKWEKEMEKQGRGASGLMHPTTQDAVANLTHLTHLSIAMD